MTARRTATPAAPAALCWPRRRLPGLILLLLSLGLVAPGALHAQAPPAREDVAKKIAAWEGALRSAAAALRDRAVTIRTLDLWQTRIGEVARDAAGVLADAKTVQKQRQELLKALGPAPASGDESPEAAERRKRLTAQAAEADKQVQLLALVVKRAETLLTRISGQRAEILNRRLFTTGPPFWSEKTWSTAVTDMGRSVTAIAAAPHVWADLPTVKQWLGGFGPFKLLLLLALALAAILWLRRYFNRISGRRDPVEQPPRQDKLRGALVILFNAGIAPAAFILLAWLLLEQDGVVVGLVGGLIQGLALGLSLLFLIRGGARAALAPWSPGWRVLDVNDSGAKRAYVLALLLGVLMALDQVLEQALYRLYLSREFLAVSGLVINGGIALVLVLSSARRMWRPPGAGPEAPWQEPGAGRALRLLARLTGLVSLAAILLNYHGLAEFLSLGSALTGLLLGGAWLLRYVVSEVAEHLLSSTSGAAQAFRRRVGLEEDGADGWRLWSMLLFDLLLAASVIFLLVLIWGSTTLSVTETLRQGWEGFTIGSVKISLSDILLAVAVFIGLVFLVRGLQQQFDERIGTQMRMDIGVRRALRAGIGYAGIIIAAAIGISLAGFDLSNLAIIAGALSVGIGFGLQAIVNNFVSGIILFVERPVKEGDWVVVDKYEGYIKRIGVRATEITTLQNAAVIMPNSKLITEPVQNWVHKDQSGRIDIDVGVAYGSNTELVHELLIECAKAHKDVLDTPAPVAWFMRFGDSSLDFQLRMFVHNIRDIYRISSDIRFAIDKAFRANGVTIPFPQRDLHVKQWPEPDSQNRGELPGNG